MLLSWWIRVALPTRALVGKLRTQQANGQYFPRLNSRRVDSRILYSTLTPIVDCRSLLEESESTRRRYVSDVGRSVQQVQRANSHGLAHTPACAPLQRL
jgi:hypothetical protein